MKTLVTKDVLSKASKKPEKKFDDPVMQGLNVELNEKFNEMQQKMLTEILEVVGYKEPLRKAREMLGQQRSSHKYIRREGGPGNYKYIYEDNQGREYTGDNAPENHPHHDPEEQTHTDQQILIAKPAAGTTTVVAKLKTVVVKGPQKNGELSTEMFKSAPGTDVNLVAGGQTSFGTASSADQRILHTLLNVVEKVLHEINIQFKTPIEFFTTGPLGANNEEAGAFYTPLEPTENSPRRQLIEMVSGSTLAQTLFHEIGHALDASFTAEGEDEFLSYKYTHKDDIPFETNQKRTPASVWNPHFIKIADAVKQTEWYKKVAEDYEEKDTGVFDDITRGEVIENYEYFNDPTEMFARAFEVYAFNKVKQLETEGKVSSIEAQLFYQHNSPDLFSLKGEYEGGRELQDDARNLENLKIKGNKVYEDIMKMRGEGVHQDKIKLLEEKYNAISNDVRRQEMKKTGIAHPKMIPETEQKKITDAVVPLIDNMLKEEKIQKSLKNLLWL